MLLLECLTLLWLFTSFQEIESVTSCNPDLAREDQDVMTTLFGRATPSEIGGDEEDHYNEVDVKGSSFVSGVRCLHGIFLRLIGQCISETYPRRTATRTMWPKTHRAPGKWGTWQLRHNEWRQWRSNYKAKGIPVVSRKGPNSWLNRSLNILVRGPADTSAWNVLAPGLWVSD